MSKQDLKHALISLILGIITMAALRFIEGLLNIMQEWISTLGGSSISAVTYLKYKNFF